MMSEYTPEELMGIQNNPGSKDLPLHIMENFMERWEETRVNLKISLENSPGISEWKRGRYQKAIED